MTDRKIKVSILVHPDLVERFKKGCEHYGMEYKRSRGSDYWIVTLAESNAGDLYWLGANLAGPVATTGLHKHVF